MKTQIEEGQNLFDLAVQCYGSAEAVFKLVDDNALDLNAVLAPGQTLKFEALPPPETASELPKTKPLQDFYLQRGLRVRTGREAAADYFCLEGVGYGAVGGAIAGHKVFKVGVFSMRRRWRRQRGERGVTGRFNPFVTMIESRALLKSHFNTGDVPTETQFAALIDSFFHRTEDHVRVGLQDYSTARDYLAGECAVVGGGVFRALQSTSGIFNPAHREQLQAGKQAYGFRLRLAKTRALTENLLPNVPAGTTAGALGLLLRYSARLFDDLGAVSPAFPAGNQILPQRGIDRQSAHHRNRLGNGCAHVTRPQPRRCPAF